jgi:hypothetical protein
MLYQKITREKKALASSAELEAASLGSLLGSRFSWIDG